MKTGFSSVSANERIQALDILRGFALLGMLIVHFGDRAAPGAGLSGLILRGVELLVSERAYATFALLFGAGFAVQLARARFRGVPFQRIWLRRQAVLAGFGAIAHGVFGYNVLLGYAVWGVPLLFLERFPTRVLLPMALVFAFNYPLYFIVRGAIEWATIGAAASDAAYAAWREGLSAAWDQLSIARDQTSIVAAVPHRIRHMAWFYVQAWNFLPGQLEFFLYGLLAYRHGLLTDPRRHARTILTWMGIGLAAWLTQWIPLPALPAGTPVRIVRGVEMWSRSYWLMFTWVGAALLIIGYKPSWRPLLTPFAITGRAALSNYFAQIITIDLLLSRYAFGLGIFPASSVLPGALIVYAALTLLTAAWFRRYQFGPLEWVWRSLTYGRRQPLRRDVFKHGDHEEHQEHKAQDQYL